MTLTDEDLTRIYTEANNCVEGKRPPITTQMIFKAMRAMKPQTEYVKYVSGDLAHYIRKDLWEREQGQISPRSMHLTAISDFVVDVENNKFVKCRYSIEMLIDSYCSISA